VSGGLLGLGLGLLLIALYPDDPEHRATNALFIPAAIAGVLVLGVYVWRQLRRLEPLIPRELLRRRGFAGEPVANLLLGAALMVALVDVPLLGRLVFSLDLLGSGLLLTQFLIGVPVGAVLGGFAGARFGPRIAATAGISLSGIAFLQMSHWDSHALAPHLGPLRVADVPLAICRFGLGAAIAPRTSSVLALTRSQSHGLATSLIVL